MWIKHICIEEPPNKKEFTFHPGINLIHSHNNSYGKTTLLRFILYGLGFTIPNLEKLHMEQCFVTITVIHGDRTIIINRHESDISVEEFNEKTYYRTPRELMAARSKIFNSDNKQLLESILGAMYIDQERGWTLLNRGKVIGSNEFQIESFLNSIAKDDVESLIIEKNKLSRELERYKQLLTLSDRQRTIDDFDKKRINLSEIESVQTSLDSLNIQLKSLKKEEKRIKESIKDNKKFIDYIDQMKLVIKVGGEIIPLTHDMIVTCPDNMSFLEARLEVTRMSISKITEKMIKTESELNKLLDEKKSDEIIEAYSIIPISKINIDSEKIQSSINLMKNRLSILNKQIESAQDKTKITTKLDSLILRNADELNVSQYIQNASRPLCKIEKLKGFSGTKYRKVILSYRLAYASLIEEVEKLTLPLIIDSPSGEVDDTNLSEMVNIFPKLYSHHQVIIASIDSLDSLEKDMTIELNTENKLIDVRKDENLLDVFLYNTGNYKPV